MRSFALCFVLIVSLVIVFGFGVSQTLAGLILLPFCLLPFVLIGLGWSARGVFSGRRLVLVETTKLPTQQRTGAASAVRRADRRESPVKVESTL